MTAYLGNNSALLRLESLQNTAWYKVQTLAPMLTNLRTINFFVQAERTAALNTISNLPNDCPYAVFSDNEQQSTTNIRFPDGVAYICQSIEPWNSYFQILTSALSFKDRGYEKTMLTNAQQATTTQSVNTPSATMMISSLNDASQAFANVISNMQDSLANNEGVYNQSAFEQNFNVTWGTPAFKNSHGLYGTPVNRVIFYSKTAFEKHQNNCIVVDFSDDSQPIVIKKRQDSLLLDSAPALIPAAEKERVHSSPH